MKTITWTCRVLDVLTRADDFMNVSDLLHALPDANYNQVTAALFHLRNRRAVEVVISDRGIGWWMATPWSDNRMRRVDERTPETKPRNRKPKKEKK